MVGLMIRSFACAKTEKIWQGLRSRKLPSEMQQVARRKLRMLDNAHALDDLRVPPNNRLEKLKGNRARQYSIRISDQWQLCFDWADGCENVEIVDYH